MDGRSGFVLALVAVALARAEGYTPITAGTGVTSVVKGPGRASIVKDVGFTLIVEGVGFTSIVEGVGFRSIVEGVGFSPADIAQNSSPSRPIAELAISRLKPDAAIPIDLEPGATLSTDALWIPQRRTSSIVRIDSKNNTPDQPIAVGKPPCGSLVILSTPPRRGEPSADPSAGDVWVPLCDAGAVARVNMRHGNVSASVPLSLAEPMGSLAVATGSVWLLTDAKGVLSRVDPATNAAVAEVYVAARPFGVAANEDVVWVTSEHGNTLTRIDGHTNAIVETITVGPRPGPIAIGEDAVWTLNRGDGSVSRVDPKSNKVVTTITVDAAVADGTIAVGEGAVWVSARGIPLVRIDARTNRVTHRFTGEGGGAILVGHGSVWVAAGPKLTWRLDPRLIAAMRP